MRTIIASALLTLSFVVNAQTLNVVEKGITYRFPASQAGDMLYADGVSLTVLGRPFALASVDSMYIDDNMVVDNSVDVVYNGTSASVFVAGNVARYVNASVTGAHVVLLQSADLADEITYLPSTGVCATASMCRLLEVISLVTGRCHCVRDGSTPIARRRPSMSDGTSMMTSTMASQKHTRDVARMYCAAGCS